MYVDSKLLIDNINWHVLSNCTLTVHKNCFFKVETEKTSCCRSMEDHQFWVQHKQGCSRRFILVPCPCTRQILAAMVLRQHRFSSSRTIEPCTPCHAQCRLCGTLLRRGPWFVQWRSTCNPVKERDPFVH